MAKQIINLGAQPNDNTGEGLRDGGIKINSNFDELYIEHLDNVITINQPSDFGTISSDKVYFVKGFVDMGSTTITVPEGVNLNIVGHNYTVSGLFSSQDNYTMFQGDVNGVGNISFYRLDLKTDGLNSKVLDFISNTGFEVISFEQVNFTDCTQVARLENFRQGEELGTGRFGGTPYIEFVGTWLGGYLIDRSITRFLDDTYTGSIFVAGTGLTFGSRFFSNMNLDLGTNGSYMDFSPSNFTRSNLLQLQNGIVTRDGNFTISDTNITPNITEKVEQSLWKGNVGLPNTDKGGVLTITTEAETTINTLDVWEDVEGTFILTKNQHTDSPANGQIRNNTDNPVDYNLISEFTILGTANNVVEMRATIFRAATSTFEPQDMFSKSVDSNVGAQDLAFLLMFDSFTLFPNDYVKYEIRNRSSSNNVTAIQDQCKFKIQQRT